MPLFADPVDHGQLVGRERRVLHGLDVVQDLLRFGGTDQNRCDLVVVQQPGKGHLGQGLTALPGKVIQGADLRKALRRDVLLLQEPPVGVDAAVGGDAVQIAVRQKPLRQRAEGDDALVQLRGGIL